MDIIFIVFLLIIILISISIYSKKEKKRKEIEEEIEEENKRIEQERKREEDLKFDKVINCPICGGYGYCYVEKSYKLESSGPYFISYTIVNKKRAEKGSWYGEDSKRHFEYYKEKCPYCKEKGIALAYFQKKSVTCQKCIEGKRTYTERVKLDVGSTEEQIVKICDECNGSGKIEVESVNIKSILDENELDPKFRLKYTYNESIDDYNRKFFSKSKDRNFQS